MTEVSPFEDIPWASEEPGTPTVTPSMNGQHPKGTLGAITAAELLEHVDAMGEPTWLIDGLWPSDAYGMIAAEAKAGKTWAIGDLALSVASGTPWLGKYPCSTPGGVLVFIGEGGERSTARRLRAIAAAKDLDLASLPLRICFRPPKLKSGEDLLSIIAELEAFPAVLVIIDPLYLAAAGAKGSDLYGMAEWLTPIQGICQKAGAALAITHHWSKTGLTKDASRMSGAGPAEWGRVLCSAAVDHKSTEADGTSNVVLSITFTGGEIPEQTFKVRRRVRATGPELSSPMEYGVEVLERVAAEAASELPPSRTRVIAALRGGGAQQTVRQLGDLIAADTQGPPLKRRTIQDALEELEAKAQVTGTEAGPGESRYWSLVEGV